LNKIEINEDECKGCGLCIRACPKGIIAIAEHKNAKGYSPAESIDPDKCTACRSCALTCPDVCITVYKD